MAGDFAGPDVNKLLGNLDALTNMLLRLRGNHSIPRSRTNALDIHELVMEVSDSALEFVEAAETIERLCRPLDTLLTEDGLKQTVAETLVTLHRTCQRCTDWAFADYLGIPRQTVKNSLDENQPGSIWVVHRPIFNKISQKMTKFEDFRDQADFFVANLYLKGYK